MLCVLFSLLAYYWYSSTLGLRNLSEHIPTGATALICTIRMIVIMVKVPCPDALSEASPPGFRAVYVLCRDGKNDPLLCWFKSGLPKTHYPFMCPDDMESPHEK